MINFLAIKSIDGKMWDIVAENTNAVLDQDVYTVLRTVKNKGQAQAVVGKIKEAINVKLTNHDDILSPYDTNCKKRLE